MKCPQCGADIEEQYNFCPQCQAKLHPDVETSDTNSSSATSTQTHQQDYYQNATSNYSQNYAQNPPPPRYNGIIPGSAYDYFTQKNQATQQQSGFSSSPDVSQPTTFYPNVNYQPPKKHTGVIVAIIIAALVVFFSLLVGFVTFLSWAGDHYYETHYSYGWDDDDIWFTNVVTPDTVNLPDGHIINFPEI